MARHIPREKVEKRVIKEPEFSLEKTYETFRNEAGEKWLFATNNDVFLNLIKGKIVNRISHGRNGRIPVEFARMMEMIVDVRMFSNYQSAINVKLVTDEDIEFFIGNARKFGLFIRKVWYGKLPDDHFPFDD